jgi:hypothetical protein
LNEATAATAATVSRTGAREGMVQCRRLRARRRGNGLGRREEEGHVVFFSLSRGMVRKETESDEPMTRPLGIRSYIVSCSKKRNPKTQDANEMRVAQRAEHERRGRRYMKDTVVKIQTHWILRSEMEKRRSCLSGKVKRRQRTEREDVPIPMTWPLHPPAPSLPALRSAYL